MTFISAPGQRDFPDKLLMIGEPEDIEWALQSLSEVWVQNGPTLEDWIRDFEFVWLNAETGKWVFPDNGVIIVLEENPVDRLIDGGWDAD